MREPCEPDEPEDPDEPEVELADWLRSLWLFRSLWLDWFVDP